MVFFLDGVSFFPEVNKCDISYQLCDQNADCHQIGDSYRCTCHDGYRGDGETCESMCQMFHPFHQNNNSI